MISILIQKEIKQILNSPKFLALYITAFVLIILSVYVGISEYNQAEEQFRASQEIAYQTMQESRSYSGLTDIVHRKTEPLQSFISGVHFDVGRRSVVNRWQDTNLVRSPYSENPIFALFRIMDLSMIIQVVLTLFAFLYTYDAINGERENGTLKLLMANGISRIELMLGKWLGILLGFLVPLLIPVAIGLLMIQIAAIPFTGEDWLRMGIFLFVSFLLLTIFIGIGLSVSSFTKRSSHAFVTLLMIWIVMVLIVPRLGVMSAGNIMPGKTQAEMDAQVTAFSQALWDNYSKELGEIWRERSEDMQEMTEEERDAYREDKQSEWESEDDLRRKDMRAEIEDFKLRQMEELSNQQEVQRSLAYGLSRISPTASYQLASMQLAGSDVGLKQRYATRIHEYKQSLTEYASRKQDESGQRGGFEINIDTEKGISFKQPRNNGGLDVSDKPEFIHPDVEMSAIWQNLTPDIAVLFGYLVMGILASCIGIVRYEIA